MAKLYEDLGRNIRKYRKEKGYSTAEFAELLDVSAGLVNNIENARNDVFRIELLTEIMNKLDVSLGELLQIKSIDFRKINIEDEGVFTMDPSMEDSDLLVSEINDHINQIIRLYLTTISEYGCTLGSVDVISTHIQQEFESLIKLHKLSDLVPNK